MQHFIETIIQVVIKWWLRIRFLRELLGKECEKMNRTVLIMRFGTENFFQGLIIIIFVIIIIFFSDYSKRRATFRDSQHVILLTTHKWFFFFNEKKKKHTTICFLHNHLFHTAPGKTYLQNQRIFYSLKEKMKLMKLPFQFPLIISKILTFSAFLHYRKYCTPEY